MHSWICMNKYLTIHCTERRLAAGVWYHRACRLVMLLMNDWKMEHKKGFQIWFVLVGKPWKLSVGSHTRTFFLLKWVLQITDYHFSSHTARLICMDILLTECLHVFSMYIGGLVTWDVNLVLDYLHSLLLDSLTLKVATLQIATLLAHHLVTLFKWGIMKIYWVALLLHMFQTYEVWYYTFWLVINQLFDYGIGNQTWIIQVAYWYQPICIRLMICCKILSVSLFSFAWICHTWGLNLLDWYLVSVSRCSEGIVHFLSTR